MNQSIQELTKGQTRKAVRKQTTYSKAQVLAVSRNIHKSSVSERDIWCIESESKKNAFYCVQYVEGDMVCDCPAFVYGVTVPCKHISAITIKETS